MVSSRLVFQVSFSLPILELVGKAMSDKVSSKTLKELYKQCFKKWGYVSQLLMLAEESSELTLETLHMTRNNRQSVEQMGKFISEFADVKIMMQEFEWYFGEPFVKSVDTEIKRKLKHLKKLLGVKEQKKETE